MPECQRGNTTATGLELKAPAIAGRQFEKRPIDAGMKNPFKMLIANGRQLNRFERAKTQRRTIKSSG